MLCGVFFFQAEDGIRDLVRSRGLGDVYKRQLQAIRIEAIRRVVRGHDQDHALGEQAVEQAAEDLSLIHI